MDVDKPWTEKDFKFERKVGEGAFGAVYKAKQVGTGDIVAIKKLKVLESDRKNFEGIVQEMRILCSIDHKNIVSYKGSFWDNDKKNVFIVMEFLGGGDLSNKIQNVKQSRGSIPESKIWSYLIQMLKGLKVLHDLKIIHRDIKSANCFLTEDFSTIKLGDMNVSKITRNNFATTQVGTPLYLSPQIWMGKPYDSKTDIWSLGVLLYEMCTLNYPFMGLNMESLKRAVKNGRYAPLPGYLNQEFSVLITKMLDMDPAKRPSVDELLNNPIILNKVRNLQDMTISDLRKMNIKLMDTIKIPQNFKNVNLPKRKTGPNGIKRSSSLTDARPDSGVSSRAKAEPSKVVPPAHQALGPIPEKSESLSNSTNSDKTKKPGLPPMAGGNPGALSNSRALPPLAKKNNNTPSYSKPDPPVSQVRAPSPSYAIIRKPPSRENSRDKLRANSRERERDLLMQARLAEASPNYRDGNLRDRYRAPSAGKGSRVNARPVWWGN